MKILSNLCQDIKDCFNNQKPIMCEYVTTPNGILPLSQPILSTEKTCDWCGTRNHYCPFFDPNLGSARIWLCGNTNCDVYTTQKTTQATLPITKPKRALLWVKFCEINGIGDEHHEVKFEDIQQTHAKISYLLKFASAPRGIVFMQGDPGTGKTYATMAVCEFYTRKDSSCIFTTAKQMSNNWLETFREDRFNHYVEKINNCSLLAIDDFGIGEPNPKFLEFFLEVINTRLQWKSRGTIITTNLKIKKFNEFCGEALSDRIMTGQTFEFKGNTRRKKTIL